MSIATRGRSSWLSFSLILLAVGCSSRPPDRAAPGPAALTTAVHSWSTVTPAGRQARPAATAVVGAVTDGPAAVSPAPAPAADPVVHALVELTGKPVATTYLEAKASGGAAVASIQSRNQLGVTLSEQVAFKQQLAAARLPGITEVYRLQRLFNGIMILTPRSNLAALRKLPGVKSVSVIRPATLDNAWTMPFINVPQLWARAGLPLHGEGIKVGVIDTGIDYTHANFGGAGTVAAYTSNDPSVVEAGSFPTAKVVGGHDFAGHLYDAASAATSVPVPDDDPLDGNGHGSHVAGTIAGFGVNADGSTFTGTYDQSLVTTDMKIGPGAAPKALLYALKVFGDNGGSTSLASLAMEWAADPNGDGTFTDHLDVVNLSLGSNYGTSADPEAVIYSNAVKVGVAVVISAGNGINGAAAGGEFYFVAGAPGTTPEVITVAASEHNVDHFAAVRVNAPAGLAGDKAAGTGSPFIGVASPLTADLVLATSTVDADPNDGCGAFTNAAAVAGKIALVNRGTCSFVIKATNAQNAGAVGIVIGNLAASSWPITMALDATITIPSRIIQFSDSTAIQAAMASATVNVTFDDTLAIALTKIPDNIASFSSRGPTRSGGHAMLKPDVAAPGVSILSTAVGTGTGSANFSGTSMAAPLTAGVVALMRQAHPTWSPADVKALIMNTAGHDTFQNSTAAPRPRVGPARTGAGRIDAASALAASVLAYDKVAPERVSVTFQALDVAAPLTETRTVQFRNTSGTSQVFALTIDPFQIPAPGTSVAVSSPTVTVPANGTADVGVTLTADPAAMTRRRDANVSNGVSGLPRVWLSETSGWLVATPQGGGSAPVLRVPYYASLNPAAAMHATAGLVPTGRTGSASLALAGTGVDTTGLAARPNGVLSLVTPMELLHAGHGDGTPLGDPLPAGYPTSELLNATLRYVGVTSNLPDATLVANAELYFGLVTAGLWGTPGEVEFDVYMKASGAPTWQFVAFNGNANASSLFGDVLLTNLVDLTSGALVGSEDFLNGVPQNLYSLPTFFSDTMVMPVLAADIGLTETASAIEFQVVSFSNGTGELVDVSPVLRYDLKHPSFAAHMDAVPGLTAAGSPPFWRDLPGTSPALTYDLDQAAATQVGGILLVHHNNAAGTRGEFVRVGTLSCVSSADCGSPDAPICDPASGICMGCLTNADCLGGAFCDFTGTRTCVEACHDPAANPCAPGAFCGAAGACLQDCRAPTAVACAPHYWCSHQSGECTPALAMVVTTVEAAGANCATGGVRIDTGWDDNDNGALDAGEIVSTRYACNGSTGGVGPKGPKGSSGCSSVGGSGSLSLLGLGLLLWRRRRAVRLGA